MTSKIIKFTEEELWSIPQTNEEHMAMITKRITVFDEHENSEKDSDNLLLIVKTALRAIDINFSDFKDLLPFEVDEISAKMSVSEVLAIFDFLSISFHTLDFGYSPYQHRLNILSDIEENKISFKMTPKLQRYLFRLKRKREEDDLDFTFRSCGGNYLKSKLMEKGLVSEGEFSQHSEEELEELAKSRFQTIHNYLYSQIGNDDKSISGLFKIISFDKLESKEYSQIGNQEYRPRS